MKYFLILFSLVFPCILLHAEIINVSDFGIKPDTFEDATEAIQKAIDKCKNTPGATLVFPKGRYDFWPDKAQSREYFISNTSSETECPSKIKKIGLLFEGISDITVQGNGSVFVFHGKMITWAFDKSKNIKVEGFSVDFERPSMTEFSIEELHPDHIIASVHPDSKYSVIDGKVRFYGEGWGMNDNFFSILTDPLQGTNVYSSWDPVGNSRASELSPFRLKLENDFSTVNYEVGKTLTTRSHIRDHVGIFVNQSENINLENITMHYMHGLGIVSQFSKNLTYRKVNIEPSRERTIAAFADGMHFSGCKGHIEITNCNIKGLHDDPINVHGTYLKIIGINSPKELTLKFMHAQTYGMQSFFENDTVAFIDSKTLQKTGFAVVNSFERISDREVKVVLSTSVPNTVKTGDCLENITCTPSLSITGCRFEMTNTRGILVSTPRKVVIENNYFYRIGMYAILIAADANSWYESGAVNDILIRNNIFDACGYNLYYDNNNYVICIEPENHERIKDHWVHRNIRIEENMFKVYDNNLLLKAKSTESLSFRKNVIERANFTPNLKGREREINKNPSFKFENCTDVEIQNNSYKLPSPTINVECTEMKKADVKTEKGIRILLK